jgi:hypothetical protein
MPLRNARVAALRGFRLGFGAVLNKKYLSSHSSPNSSQYLWKFRSIVSSSSAVNESGGSSSKRKRRSVLMHFLLPLQPLVVQFPPLFLQTSASIMMRRDFGDFSGEEVLEEKGFPEAPPGVAMVFGVVEKELYIGDVIRVKDESVFATCSFAA